MIRQHWDALTRYVRTQHPNLARVRVVEGLALAAALWAVAIIAAMLVPLDRWPAWAWLELGTITLSVSAALLYVFSAAVRVHSARGVSTRGLIVQAAAIALVSVSISTASLGGMLSFRLHATLALDAEDVRAVNCEAAYRARAEWYVAPPSEFWTHIPDRSVCADVLDDADYRFRTMHEVTHAPAWRATWRADWLDPEMEIRAHSYAEAYVGHGFASTARAPVIRDDLLVHIGAALFLTGLVFVATAVLPRWRPISRRRGYLAAGKWALALAVVSVGAACSIQTVAALGFGDESVLHGLTLLLFASALVLGSRLRWNQRYPLDRVLGVALTLTLAVALVITSAASDWLLDFEIEAYRRYLLQFVATGLVYAVYAVWFHRRVASLPD